MMISLTETTRRLHIGKRRLYQMLENEGITPTLKSGHKLLDQNQFNLVWNQFNLDLIQFNLLD